MRKSVQKYVTPALRHTWKKAKRVGWMGKRTRRLNRISLGDGVYHGPSLTQIEKAGVQHNRKVGSDRIGTLVPCREGIVVLQIAVIIRRAGHIRDTTNGCMEF